MYIFLFVVLALYIFIVLFLRLPRFGSLSKGARLERIKASPNYKNGAFQNQSTTATFTANSNIVTVMIDFLFRKNKHVQPAEKIPTIKTDLLNLNINENVLVWFGHSSYFMQVDKKRILVDPVFCGHASPFSFSTKAFAGTDIYTTDDLPAIDYLFISHDHWDHLDYVTVKKLQPKVGKVICGLGTAAHLERWGYTTEQIIEKDWYEKIVLDNEVIVNTVPARHFSGRLFKRNQSLWMAFALQTKTMKIFIGGDSGYDKQFAEAGEKFGPFDLAILENGQYNKNWSHIHTMPHEQIQVVKDLKASKVLSVHNSKFALSTHDWKEPMTLMAENCRINNIHLLTPMIGEKVNLLDDGQTFKQWWEGRS